LFKTKTGTKIKIAIIYDIVQDKSTIVGYEVAEESKPAPNPTPSTQ